MAKLSIHTMLNLVLVLELTQAINDDLEITSDYRHQIKFHSKGLKSEMKLLLEKNLDKYYNSDAELYLNFQTNLDELIKTISELCIDLKPTDFLIINQIIKSYLGNKEDFFNKFEIELKELKNQ